MPRWRCICTRWFYTAKQRHRNMTTVFLLTCFLVTQWWILHTYIFTHHYLVWIPKQLPTRDTASKHFILGRDQEIYMYSAIANIPNPDVEEAEIVITTLDKSRVYYDCCVLLSDNKTLVVTPANIYFQNYVTRISVNNRIKEYFTPTFYAARQYSCSVPSTSASSRPAYVTLTSSKCSPDIKDYLPIHYTTPQPGKLALCAKIAHSGGLDPEKVIEWFEVQRILGVDKILMYDLGNPDSLTRVFRYYQKLGILDLQPYELPGYPRNRSLKEEFKHTPQFVQDETMAVLECRQRMAGYDHVMSHDVDEFIIPRENIRLKNLLKIAEERHPQSAGFYFYTAFFITTWTPTNPEEDLMVKRYRKTRVPRWECYKYVYRPSRVITSITHEIFTKDSYDTARIPTDEAILHHYRECPRDTWGTCTVSTQIDDVMTRYTDLDLRVMKVRNATMTRPKWTPVKRRHG